MFGFLNYPEALPTVFGYHRFYSPIGGGISTLENGNILTTHATDCGNPFLGEIVNGRVMELSRDDSLTGAEVVWELTLNQDYGSYKAIRVPSEALSGWNSHVIQPESGSEVFF